MSPYEQVQSELRESPRRWFVTGVAGFIGSHLLEALLNLDQKVVMPDAQPGLSAVYNIAAAERTSLNQLYRMLQDGVGELQPGLASAELRLPRLPDWGRPAFRGRHQQGETGAPV